MKPLGLKPKRFPGKTDIHPPKGLVNWWEADGKEENKARHKRDGIKEIEMELETLPVCNEVNP